MPITAALAAVAVADIDRAKEFYAAVFERPADLEPMPSLAQWDLEGGGSLQVVEDAELAGSSMATLLATDFDAVRTRLEAGGVELSDTVAGTIARLTQLTDPDGNIITVAEVPPTS